MMVRCMQSSLKQTQQIQPSARSECPCIHEETFPVTTSHSFNSFSCDAMFVPDLRDDRPEFPAMPKARSLRAQKERYDHLRHDDDSPGNSGQHNFKSSTPHFTRAIYLVHHE